MVRICPVDYQHSSPAPSHNQTDPLPTSEVLNPAIYSWVCGQQSGQPMSSETYSLFRSAILREQQVTCSYDGLRTSSAPATAAKRSCWRGSLAAKVLGVCRSGGACGSPTSEPRGRAQALGMRAARTERSRPASARSILISTFTFANGDEWAVCAVRNVIYLASRSAYSIASIMLRSLAMPWPAISKAVP